MISLRASSLIRPHAPAGGDTKSSPATDAVKGRAAGPEALPLTSEGAGGTYLHSHRQAPTLRDDPLDFNHTYTVRNCSLVWASS